MKTSEEANDVALRLARLEAGQHFQMAMVSAVMELVPENAALRAKIKRNLARHLAMLVAESTSELTLSCFQELISLIG